jgi:hypothetical protein
MNQRSSFSSDDWKRVTWENGAFIWMDYWKHIPDVVPVAIRDLRPQRIIVYDDYVKICLCFSPRVCITGFGLKADQFGQIRLMDGLWLITEAKWQAKRIFYLTNGVESCISERSGTLNIERPTSKLPEKQ